MTKIEIADSHAHLDMEEFAPDRGDVLERAWEGGVRALLCPAELTGLRSLALILELVEHYSWIAAAAGVHPHHAKEFGPQHLDKIEELARTGKIKAVGEIGLDYHYDLSPADRQKNVLRSQLRVAQDLGLPVILHSRKSGRDIIAAVDEEGFRRGGILHCFTEDWDTARLALDRGFYISFSGILTFPNARELRQTAKKIPLNRVLVETDSPYLVPAPWRGQKKRNEPLFVIETARVLAELKDVGLEDIARTTLRNFQTLFSV